MAPVFGTAQNETAPAQYGAARTMLERSIALDLVPGIYYQYVLCPTFGSPKLDTHSVKNDYTD